MEVSSSSSLLEMQKMQKYAAITVSDEHNQDPEVLNSVFDSFEEDHYGLMTTQDPHGDSHIDLSLIPLKGIADVREMNYVLDINQLRAAYFSKSHKERKIKFKFPKTGLRE